MKAPRYLPTVILTVMAAAAMGGCASVSQQDRLAAELQYPQLTPKEKWSDAMVILRDDMGIEGQTDLPQTRRGDRDLAVAQLRRRFSPSNDPLAGATLAVTGAFSPPTGMSSGAAVGAGLALALIPTSPPSPMWVFSQVAAWVPASEANNVDEAAKVAASKWQAARERTYATLSKMQAHPSKHPEGSDKDRITLADRLNRVAIKPDGGPTAGPSFLPAGEYYGPIFFQMVGWQYRADARASKMDPYQGIIEISQHLPPYFAVYFSGKTPEYGKGEIPASIYVAGKQYPFVGK